VIADLEDAVFDDGIAVGVASAGQLDEVLPDFGQIKVSGNVAINLR
jgi:hypothetical protein